MYVFVDKQIGKVILTLILIYAYFNVFSHRKRSFSPDFYLRGPSGPCFEGAGSGQEKWGEGEGAGVGAGWVGIWVEFVGGAGRGWDFSVVERICGVVGAGDECDLSDEYEYLE